ncbi:unnamed protein product, partial [Nesidiocoris tenuis]
MRLSCRPDARRPLLESTGCSSRGPKIVVVAAFPYHKREVWNLGRESVDPRCGRNSMSRTAV